MGQQLPKHILCAVRSRPGGEETVDRAIKLALKTGARLTFCQIIDTGFLNRFSSRGSARKVAQKELTDMAEFALSIICDQAEAKGVADVDYILRTGNVRHALLELVNETDADLLVLGRSKPMPGHSAFPDQTRNEFIAQLEATGVIVDN
jgi:nucleotide-binding universal stress UspA family protein